MKNIIPLLSAALFVLSSCNQHIHPSKSDSTKTDTVSSPAAEQSQGKPLFATMQIKDNSKDQVKLKFTVYNQADSVQHFCKWHTPFEPLMSKYLEIKDENGEEAAYQGPMAKRMMPPPADSYLKVNPGDSLSVDVDVSKGYAIKKAGKYTISYTGQNMSGLIVKDSVVLVYPKP
ncbi:MAG TPA: protease [Pedobacter sp.]